LRPFIRRSRTLACKPDGATPRFEDFVDSIRGPPRSTPVHDPVGQPMDAMIDAVNAIAGSSGDTTSTVATPISTYQRRRSAAFNGRAGIRRDGGFRGGEEAHARPIDDGGRTGSTRFWTQLPPHAQRIAAKVSRRRLVDHLGPMGRAISSRPVHNGIEYADIKWIAEFYGLLRAAGGKARRRSSPCSSVAEGLRSYLIEVSAADCKTVDAGTAVPDGGPDP